MASDHGRDASCQECLLQAVSFKHGGYTPLQLLFGHEPAPIEGEAFDDEQQNRSITVSMAERRARQQSLWNSCLLLESRRSEYGSLPTIRQGSTAILNKHKGAWLALRQFWLRRWVGVKSNTIRLMAQTGSWCRNDFCDVYLNTCDISANVKVCRLIETKGTRIKLERSPTLFRISVSRKAHTLIFEASMILLTGPVRDTSVEFFFANAKRNARIEFKWNEDRNKTCF